MRSQKTKMRRKIMEFDERVLFVVRNFVEYGNYGKIETRAIKVIHKHFPKKNIEDIRHMFFSYVRVFQNAIDFVDRHRDFYWDRYKKKLITPLHSNTAEEQLFIDQNRDVPEIIIKMMIYWIFDWHHVR
jgi:hypothetical protein